ncbi:hypothetical protein QJS04_geneDACA011806 [Acorus gramineus]|uniref:Uncharacterized protein n=1 Tax=Acorus gramineus TaxID=55184 RepID=A0AAV9BEW9_ACOGR|nr:hypothetical protein QJS04_geneDACA011806 [Acorus gramineus]
MGSLSPLQSPPRANPAATSASFRIYAAFYNKDPTNPSDSSSTWIQSYNPSDTWTGPRVPIPGLSHDQILKDFSMVSLADHLYIIGGHLSPRRRPTPDSPEADLSVVVARVLRYSVAGDEWSECAPMGTPRFDFACAVCDGKIYVAGGRSGGARGTSSAEAYDPATDSWEQLPSMGAARYKCVGVTWRGRFHVVGGFTFEGPFSIERSSAEAYEPWRGAWELVPGMWQLDVPPNQIIGVGDDERLFSSGDCLNTWKGHVEAYDWKMNIWNVVEGSQLREMSSLLEDYGEGDDEAAPKQVYVTMAAIGNVLHFLAGYRLVGGGGDHCVSMLHTFDTSAVRDGWRTTELVREEGCNKELCSHCCVVLHVS